MKKNKFKSVTPLAYGVLVEVPEVPEKVGGIFTPEDFRRRETMRNTVGTIIGLCSSAFNEAHWAVKPKVGDMVLFEQLAGQEVNVNGVNARIIKDEQVRAIVELDNE